MTRETFYVAMTRGRQANTTYVTLDAPHDYATPVPQETTPRAVLAGVLRRRGADLSGHQAQRDQQERWGSVAQLSAEQDTIATVLDRDRWVALLRRSGLDAGDVDAVITSGAFGPLCAALWRAEAAGYDADVLVPVLVGRRSVSDADDVAAVLHHRVVAATRREPRRTRIGQPVGSGVTTGTSKRNAHDERRASAPVFGMCDRGEPPPCLGLTQL